MNELGRYNRAVSLLSTALRLNPEDRDTRNSIGYSHLNLGRTILQSDRGRAIWHLDEAIKHYREALKLTGETPDQLIRVNIRIAYYTKGLTSFSINEFDDAEKAFLQSQKYDPYWELMMWLGKVYLEKDDSKSALIWLNRAKENCPEKPNMEIEGLIERTHELERASISE